VRRAALVVAALALGGCESTAEKSAELERAAKRAAGSQQALAQSLSVTRPSAYVKVLGATLVHTSEGAAVAVRVRNDSAHALQKVPIAITLKDAGGRTVFQNNSPGSEAALASVPSIPARGGLTWVDDQVPANSKASTVSAIVGEAPASGASVPALSVSGVHLSEEASGPGAAGTITNRSQTAQLHLVVFVVARRGGSIVAAGRAVLPEVPAGASSPFQAFFVGDPKGAQLEVSAPPVTLG
jgi:hypothetical protein